MGASGWKYFTPYQPDVEAALQQLRQQVFEKGEYGFSNVLAQMAADRPELREQVEKMRKAEQEARGSGSGFQSIEELVGACAEDGTHSILDIETVANAPDFGVAFPTPESVLQDFFGTTKPTRDQVESINAWKLEDAAGVDRWQATWFIAYKDDQPSEYFFVGHSGD